MTAAVGAASTVTDSNSEAAAIPACGMPATREFGGAAFKRWITDVYCRNVVGLRHPRRASSSLICAGSNAGSRREEGQHDAGQGFGDTEGADCPSYPS